MENKALLETLLNTAADGIIVIDARGSVRVFNSACERLFGYSPNEVIGNNVKMLMPAPYHGEHDEYLSRYVATGEKRIIGIGRQVLGRRKDGSTFPMYLSVGEGQVDGGRIFVGIIHDLTDQRAAEHRLQELQAEFLHVSRLSEIGQMASALAHELNQPLTAIASFTRAARRMLATADETSLERARDTLDKVADQSIRAGDIIRRLRDFVARGDTEKSVENLATLAEDTVALAAAANRLDGVAIRRDFPANEALCVVDKVQIQQVLLNLIRNAAEAMDGQRVRNIVLSVLPGSSTVEIGVHDNGPGLPAEVASRLFEPFITTKKNGMGVGLSICRTIVESHGGRLWAESNADGGTTFRIALTRFHPEAESDRA